MKNHLTFDRLYIYQLNAHPEFDRNDAICGRAWRTHPKLTGDEKNEVLSVQSSRTAGFNRDLLLVAGRMMFDDRMETKVYREYLRIEMTR